MSKRQFRQSKQAKPTDASYPTLDSFDEGRRGFLARLGAMVLGATTLAAGLAACDSRRPVGGEPDGMVGPEGVAPAPDARIDIGPDGEPIGPMGVAPMPEAQLDAGPPKKDTMAYPGYAPTMDARTDGECPNP